VTTKHFAGALVLSAALLAGPSLALAQGGDMAGMKGMDMGHAIVIPKGALYTKADVEFMQGMIAHHAQAIVMSRMAESHGANPQVLKLSNKIDQSQLPEIHIMQGWLEEWTPKAVDAARQLQPIWSQISEKVIRFEDSFERSRLRFEGLVSDIGLEAPKGVTA